MTVVASQNCSSPSTPFLPFEERWSQLTGLFASTPENSPKTLVGRVTWLKDVVVAFLLCIPVVGHVLWYFPCMRFQVNEPAAPVEIPNVVLPNIGNTCWLNAVCQVILRTPTFTRRIIAICKQPDPPALVVLLNQLVKTIGTGKACETMTALVDFAGRNKLLTNGRGQPGDGARFFERFVSDIGMEVCGHEIKSADEKSYTSNCLYRSPSSKNQPRTYLQALQDNTIGRGQYFLTKVPPVLVFCMDTKDDKNWVEDPGCRSGKFDCLFVQGLRKNITYRLSAVTVYHGAVLESGTYTAQQIDPPNHYGNLKVARFTPAQIDESIKSSIISVWEIEDPSLVDPSYNLTTQL